jgi:hypothetical protein
MPRHDPMPLRDPPFSHLYMPADLLGCSGIVCGTCNVRYAVQISILYAVQFAFVCPNECVAYLASHAIHQLLKHAYHVSEEGGVTCWCALPQACMLALHG